MLSDTGPNSLIQAQSIPHQTHTAIVALSAQHNAANSAISISQKSSRHMSVLQTTKSPFRMPIVTTKDVLSQMLRTAIRYSQHKSPLVSAITAKTQKTGPRSQEKTSSNRKPLFHNRCSPHNKSPISAGFRQCSHHASHNHLSSQQQSPASQRQSTLESAAIPNPCLSNLSSFLPANYSRVPSHTHTHQLISLGSPYICTPLSNSGTIVGVTPKC